MEITSFAKELERRQQAKELAEGSAARQAATNHQAFGTLKDSLSELYRQHVVLATTGKYGVSFGLFKLADSSVEVRVAGQGGDTTLKVISGTFPTYVVLRRIEHNEQGDVADDTPFEYGEWTMDEFASRLQAAIFKAAQLI